MALKNTHQYDDIIGLPRPVSPHRCRMSTYDRAAQFSPFAALTGFEAAIQETARLTDTKIELSEDERAILDETMAGIREDLPSRPEISVTWFVYDESKTGGSYVTRQGNVKGLDVHRGYLLLTDGTAIPTREIIHLQRNEKSDKL